MSRRTDDLRSRAVHAQVTVAVAVMALLLGGCFAPSQSPAPPSNPLSVGGTQPSSVSKQTFLARLIGLCAGVDERLAAAGPTPPHAMVADELEGLVRQVVKGGQIPDVDRDKFNDMILALIGFASAERAVAAAATSPSPSSSPTPTPTPSPSPAPSPTPPHATDGTGKTVEEQEKAAHDEAERAAQAYGMPRLEDCPKMVAASWKPLKPAPLAVQQVGSAVVDRAVWVMGGITEGAATARTAKYDTDLETWTPGPDLPSPLHHLMAVNYHDEPAVLGGFTPQGDELLGGTSAAVYRLQDGQWQAMPSLLHARAAGAAVVVGNQIVVVGGRDTQALVEPTEIFDGTRWREAPAPPVPGDHLAAVTDGTFVYVVGGRALTADKNTAAVQRFDPVHDTWTRLTDLPAARGDLAATFVDGRIVTAGGEDVSTVYGDCNVYDIAHQTWSPLASLATPRHGLALDAVGPRIFAIGGATRPTHTASTAAVGELDLRPAGAPTASGTASPTSASPSPTPAGGGLGDAGVCPGDQQSAVHACLTRVIKGAGRLQIAFTVNVPLSTQEDGTHQHLHFYLANPDGHGGTAPDASIMQAMAPHPGSWFNVYSTDVTVIDGSTERGGQKLPLDLQNFSLLCVRVATGLHSLAKDRTGGLRTGNCVSIGQ